MKRPAIAVLLLAPVALTAILVGGDLTGASPGATERVSEDSAGNGGDDLSGAAAISADGRYVAFVSRATNLVSGDTNDFYDVFVHDRQAGATERASVDSSGNEKNTNGLDPSISGDGRYVAFEWDFGVWVHDRETGITEMVSVDSAGIEANNSSNDPTISADGRYVAFESGATNLVADDTNGEGDVFVHDRQTGATERVSVDSQGAQVNDDSNDPAISVDGRYVAFVSYATNLVPGDTNDKRDIFVHDRQTEVTERVSVDSVGNEGDDTSYSPAISADGRYVAFVSYATNLVPVDTDACVHATYHWNCEDVFVHDRETGVTEKVSVDSAGNEANKESANPAISGGGRYVAFHSEASNLVPSDTNHSEDVFVHDRQTGATELVSVDSAGNQGLCWSKYPAITADGRYVAFDSCVENLVPGDTNTCSTTPAIGQGSSYGRPGTCPDVFVHDRGTGAPDLGGSPEPVQGSMQNCPQPGQWAIAVWDGDNGAAADQAFATCGEGAVAAAYNIDPDTQVWSRWFAGRPEISNLTTLSNSEGVIVLGSGVSAASTGSDEPVRAAANGMLGCPQPGKWAISVWTGMSGTPTDQAVASCAGATVTAAYWLEPQTQAWKRYFDGRPEISNLATLSQMQGIITLGG